MASGVVASGVVKRLQRRPTGGVRRTRSADSLARLTDFAKRLVAVPRSAVVEPPASGRKRSVPVRVVSRHK
jgi:hypothetical protein